MPVCEVDKQSYTHTLVCVTSLGQTSGIFNDFSFPLDGNEKKGRH